MRQIVIPRAGAPEILEIREAPTPTAAAGQVLIDVRAIGVNFADIMARKGLYQDAPPFPCVVGYEVSGVVNAVGSGVSRVKPGQRVLAMTQFQGYSTQVCVPEGQVFAIPDSLPFAEAASIPVVYSTAWALLMAMGSLRKGDTLLIQNAGGGVGLAAIDIARQVGATTIGTASGRKHEFLRSRGLDHAIDYRTQNFDDEVMRLTQGRGVELIIDPMGGEYWKRNYKVLRSTGRLGMFGASTMTEARTKVGAIAKMAVNMPLYNPVGLMNGNKGVFGVNMGHMWHETEMVSRWIGEIVAGLQAGWVRPYVDKTFPFEQAAEAHAFIEGRGNMGKVILTVG